MRIMAYTLQEPPKDVVLAFQPGQQMPREFKWIELLTVQLAYTTMNLFLVVANQLAGYFFERNDEEMNSTTPDQAVAPYVAPYTAIGVSTVTYTVSERRQIRVNLQTIEDAIH